MPDPSQSSDERLSQLQMRTRMIHRASLTGRWDNNHHVVPPMTASATFRLESAERGVPGLEDWHDTYADLSAALGHA